MSYLPKSILSKLVLSIIVMFIIGFIFFICYIIPTLKKEINTLTQKQQENTVQYIANIIDEKISHDLNHINYLANSINKSKINSKHKLFELLNMHSDFVSLFKYGLVILDKNGKVLVQSRRIEGRENLNFANTTWFKKTKSTKKNVISSPFTCREQQEPVINIISPIIDKDQKFIGAIYITRILDNTGFLSFLYKQNMGNFLIVNPENKLFITSNFSKNKIEVTPEKIFNYFKQNNTKFINENNNKNMIITAKKIKNTQWYVLITTPKKDAYKVVELFIRDLKILGFIFILIFSISLAIIIFVILRPLKNLANIVKCLDPRKKALQKIKLNRKDEIGDLIIGFNNLINTVNNYTLKLEQLARKDGLTGIYNRRFFDENLETKWNEKTREKGKLSLLMIDIDYFKKYNDTYGHQKGDSCLQKISKQIKVKLKRASDLLCRYGGEEFVVIINGDEKEASRLAKKIKNSIYKLNIEHIKSSYKKVTISIGISSLIASAKESPKTLIKQADEALYKSKEAGRNKISLYKDKKNVLVNNF